MGSVSKNALFLLELMLMLLIFSLSAAACVRIFSHARSLTDQSSALSHGVIKTQSAIAAYQYAQGDVEKAASVFAEDKAEVTAEGFTVYYDATWAACSETEGVYQLTLVQEGDTASIRVSVVDANLLYEAQAMALTGGAPIE